MASISAAAMSSMHWIGPASSIRCWPVKGSRAMTFKAAAIQMCSGVDPEKNAADMARLVREAAAKGAVYVQTPEMTGAVQKDRQGLRAVLKGEADDIIVSTAQDLARELGIHVHVGSTAIAVDGDEKIANRGFLFAPGGSRICTYDKIHMFDV